MQRHNPILSILFDEGQPEEARAAFSETVKASRQACEAHLSAPKSDQVLVDGHNIFEHLYREHYLNVPWSDLAFLSAEDYPLIPNIILKQATLHTQTLERIPDDPYAKGWLLLNAFLYDTYQLFAEQHNSPPEHFEKSLQDLVKYYTPLAEEIWPNTQENYVYGFHDSPGIPSPRDGINTLLGLALLHGLGFETRPSDNGRVFLEYTMNGKPLTILHTVEDTMRSIIINQPPSQHTTATPDQYISYGSPSEKIHLLSTGLYMIPSLHTILRSQQELLNDKNMATVIQKSLCMERFAGRN